MNSGNRRRGGYGHLLVYTGFELDPKKPRSPSSRFDPADTLNNLRQLLDGDSRLDAGIDLANIGRYLVLSTSK